MLTTTHHDNDCSNHNPSNHSDDHQPACYYHNDNHDNGCSCYHDNHYYRCSLTAASPSCQWLSRKRHLFQHY